jgi:peptidoglycan hydrolase-like protein with peptidoglycan-binding domain
MVDQIKVAFAMQVWSYIMKYAIFAGISAVALGLGGCSIFDHSQASSNRSPATSNSTYSGTSSRETSPSSISTSTSHRIASSEELRQAQQELKDHGDYAGTVDGKFGPKTAAALKKFQKSNGLKQSGELDTQTASKLGVTATSGSSMPPPSSDTTHQ